MHLILFIVLNLVIYLTYFYFYNKLPERMASHFGFSSQADGWSTRRGFVTSFLVIQTFTSLVFLGIYFLIPRADPNLPNKEYYLSEPRKHETISFIRNLLLDIGSYTLLLLLATSFFVFDVNMKGGSSLSPLMNVFIALYMLAVFGTVLRLYLKFRKIK